MRRTPEPELMNEEDQVRAYAEADYSEPHDACVQAFRDRFPDVVGGRAVDLGCGPGDITIRFARALPDLALVGVDGADRMLDWARGAAAEAGLSGRIGFTQAHLPTDLGEHEPFETVLSNSLLHHLDDPAALWRTVRAVGRPGAAVAVMDLMRPESEERVRWMVETYGGDAPEVLRHDFAASLRAAYEIAEVRAQVGAAGLDGLAVEAISDRHLYVSGRLP